MAREKIDYARAKLPVMLGLYDSVGGYIGDVSRKLAGSWKRSVRAPGGCWIGRASWDGEPDEMRDIFQNGMLYELRETAGGLVTWEGFLAEMTLTYRGVAYARSWSGVANRVKAEYSRIGANLVTNPSCEAAVWDAYNTPSVRERSAAWASDGNYSAHVTADAIDDGVVIATGMSCTAKRAYQGHVSINLISGTWRLEIYNAAGVIDYSDTTLTGESVLYVGYDETMFTAAQTVGMRLYCTDAAGEVYADAAVFQESPARAETQWYNSLSSIAEYGVIEDVLMLSGTSDTIAANTAVRSLKERAFARVIPPRSLALQKDVARLDLTFCGYAFTLRNKMTSLRGTQAASSAIVRSSVTAAQFVTAGAIKDNATVFAVEDRTGYRAWNVIADVCAAGDAAGNRWTAVVMPGKRLDYTMVDPTPIARVQSGNILGTGGGMLEGWLAAPGYVALDDLPIAYDAPSGDSADMQRLAWFDEVEWSLPDYLEDGGGITYKQGVSV